MTADLIVDMDRTAETSATSPAIPVSAQPDSPFDDVTIAAMLRGAELGRDLWIARQPIWHLPTLRCVGFELLMRLTGPSGEPVPPLRFIPVAEEQGLVGDLGAWILREAVNQLVAEPMIEVLTVNVSAHQLGCGAVAAQVGEELAAGRISSDRLVVEVTESVATNARAAAELTDIHSMGVGVGIDDFGTGYNSLLSLCSFPLSWLKVDRELVSGNTARHRAIGRACLTFANSLNVVSVAEGLETMAAVEAAMAAGFTHGQGYALGRPVAAPASPKRVAAP